MKSRKLAYQVEKIKLNAKQKKTQFSLQTEKITYV